MNDQDVDDALDDLVKLLPESLRADWVVTSKRAITKTYLVGTIHGSGLALFIVGIAFDVEALRLAYPVAFVCMLLATKYLPWWREDKELSQLSRAKRDSNK
jgi:hypothetical protein